MASRSAQSVRADADQAATEAANDAAANAVAAASDAQDATQKANDAAANANAAVDRFLQLVSVQSRTLTLRLGDGLNPSTKNVEFLGDTYENAIVTFNAPR